MSGIRLLLVDDEPQVCAAMGELLTSYPAFRVVGEAHSREEALNLLEKQGAEAVFTDIQMDGGSGFELAEEIHARSPETLVVFLTGYANFALEGYVYGPVDFLVKPVSPERLEQTLARIEARLAQRQRPAEHSRLGLPTEDGYRLVDPEDIGWLEKDARRVKVIWKDGSWVHTGKSMQELEEMFSDYGFFRCHQSYLVPVRNISSIQKESFGRTYQLRLLGGETLQLSRQKYYELKELLQKQGK